MFSEGQLGIQVHQEDPHCLPSFLNTRYREVTSIFLFYMKKLQIKKNAHEIYIQKEKRRSIFFHVSKATVPIPYLLTWGSLLWQKGYGEYLNNFLKEQHSCLSPNSRLNINKDHQYVFDQWIMKLHLLKCTKWAQRYH